MYYAAVTPSYVGLLRGLEPFNLTTRPLNPLFKNNLIGGYLYITIIQTIMIHVKLLFVKSLVLLLL